MRRGAADEQLPHAVHLFRKDCLEDLFPVRVVPEMCSGDRKRGFLRAQEELFCDGPLGDGNKTPQARRAEGNLSPSMANVGNPNPLRDSAVVAIV